MLANNRLFYAKVNNVLHTMKAKQCTMLYYESQRVYKDTIPRKECLWLREDTMKARESRLKILIK